MERRDFFKLGLTGAGVVAASRLSSGTLGVKSAEMSQNAGHPWWVKGLDKPKLSIDDSVYSRFNSKSTVFGSLPRYLSQEKINEVREHGKENKMKYYKENRPGYRLEDRALCDAAWFIHSQGGMNRGTRSWTSSFMQTPEQRGVEKYGGSPKEAARLVKAAARFFGAATTGIAVLDRRHLYTHGGGQPVVFENVEQPYSDEDKHVIPEKCKYAIALSIQMPLDNIQCSESAISDAASSIGYSRCEFAVAGLAQFIRGLGYVAIPSVNDLGSSVAIAVDAGLGELARFNRLITPEFGPSVRLAKVITDLPLALDKPIDFGLVEFCKVCKRCAEACPPQCLSFDDEPSFKVKGEWNNPGHQAWFENSPQCYAYWRESTTYCTICFAVCPWSKKDKTMIHEIVKASSAKIPALDGFFTAMDEAFGYGERKSPEKWWHLNLPEYGIDTTQGKG